MKTTNYIAQKYHKGITLFLFLYFIISPILFAFSVSDKCDGDCDLIQEVHNCFTMDMEENCCDMMDMKHDYSSSSCDMEFDINTCSIVNDVVSSNNYVVTQKFQSEQNLSIIATIDQYSEDYNLLLTEHTHIIITEKSPPIYVSVQSFLN